MDIPSEKPVEAARNEIDRPLPSAPSNKTWGSDAIAAAIRELDIPYVALNPGSSYRGLHDSLVNYLGNRRPRMLLCLHEESAVALAHGWAKVTGRPMLAIVHANVGLDACDDGDLQRLVRPGAGDRARRHRRARCDTAAAMDRMDPHRARPGCVDPQFLQMGRPAFLDRRGARGCVARQHDRADGAARAGLSQFRSGLAGGRDRNRAGYARHRALRSATVARARRRAGAAGGGIAGAGRAAGDPDGPRLARSRVVAAPGGAGRGGRRAGHDRPQDRRGVPDRSSIACRRFGSGRADYRRPT